MGNNPDITFKIRPKRVTPQFRREREEAYVACSFLPAAKPSGPRNCASCSSCCGGSSFMPTFSWVMSSLFPIHNFFGGWDMSLLDQFSLWGGIQFIYFQSFFCCRRSLDKVWSCFFLFFEASSALSLSNMLRLRQITKRGEGGEQKGTINLLFRKSLLHSLYIIHPTKATAHQGRCDISRTLCLKNKGITHKMEMESYWWKTFTEIL